MFESETVIFDVDRNGSGGQIETEELRKLLNTTGTRRCGRCQESVKFVVKVRFLGTMYPIPTDTQEENGMLTFSL